VSAVAVVSVSGYAVFGWNIAHAPDTEVIVFLKDNTGKIMKAAGATVELFDDEPHPKPKKPAIYTGATDKNGIHVVKGTQLDPGTKYFFMGSRSGYVPRYHGQTPGKPINLQLGVKYPPP
jgi:hypothetical protein